MCIMNCCSDLEIVIREYYGVGLQYDLHFDNLDMFIESFDYFYLITG